MKKLRGLMAISAALLFYAAPAKAQFFRNMLNSAKQTAQNRTNDKASQATNKAFDKADNAVQSKSAKERAPVEAADTSPINKVLGAFVKTANDNPNDTSAADLTMKALGNLAGGGGVSAADSVKAVKSFQSAKGGSGFFYQYITTITSKQRGTNSDTSNKYFTAGGEARSEMDFPGMMGVKGGNRLTILAHADQRRYSLVLDAAQKTYSLNVIDTTLANAGGRTNYKVTKIGNETLLGYQSTHARLVSTSGFGAFSSSTTMDIWTSTEVPGALLLKNKLTDQHTTPAMLQAMDQAGCGGFFVKMTSQTKDIAVTMVLTKVQPKTFPASLFQIPVGYTESKQNMFFHIMGSRK